MSDYYKSLITDDEVIKELVKESKRREGKLPTEATRLKPNLNFFQRTVNSLVSSNTRIDRTQDSFKTEYLKDCSLDKSETSDFDHLKKSSIDYAFEREIVLQTKINFVKSSEAFSSGLAGRGKKKIEIKKISFISKAASTSNRGCKGGSSAKTNNKHINQIVNLGNISNDKEGNDLTLRLKDKERRTAYKSIATKNNKTESSSKRRTRSTSIEETNNKHNQMLKQNNFRDSEKNDLILRLRDKERRTSSKSISTKNNKTGFTSKRGSKRSTTVEPDNNHSNKMLKLGNISSNSEDNDLISRLSESKERKTMCKNIATKNNSTGVKNKSKKLNSNDVICISSDDGSIEILSSSSEDNEINNKVKTWVKKRKSNLTDKSDEEYGKRPRRKKHKKKKRNVDKG